MTITVPAPKVELYIGAEWKTITSETVAASVEIQHGRSPGAIQAESDTLTCEIMNDGGKVTEGNPLSPWYPYIGRGCKIRVSATISGSDVQRYCGWIDTMVATYPTPTTCRVAITAVGALGQIGQGSDPLLSPIRRTMIGTAPGDYVPDFYWPGEDEAGSLSMASAISGVGPVAVSGPPTFAGDATLAGSDPLPMFAVGQGAQATIPTYTIEDAYVVSWWMKVPAEPAATVTLARVNASGTMATWSVTLVPGASSELHLMGRDASGATLVDQSLVMGTAPSTESAFYDNWFLYSLQVQQVGLNVSVGLSVRSIESPFAVTTITTTQFANLTDALLNQTIGIVKSFRQPGLVALSFGHLAIYAAAATDYMGGVGDYYNVKAMLGWTGEEAHDRFARLCTEHGRAYVVYGSTSVAMGPQRKGTLGENLQDCEDADRGLLHDGGTDGAVVYVCSDYLTNHDNDFTIPKAIFADGLAAIWDNQLTVNDATASRPGGSSARVTDEAHIAKVGKRWLASPSANVATDEQVADAAGWAVNIGTAPGPRYNAVELIGDSAAGIAIAAQLAALTVGKRVQAAEASLPVQHPPGGLDQLIVGASEIIDAVEWRIAPHTVPYSPYVVGVLAEDAGDTDPYMGWLAADSCDLHASVNSSATSWQVNSVPLWTTTADDFPVQVVIGGEPVTVTAVSGGSNPQTWTVTRSATLAKAHTAGDDIELVHPIILTLI